MQLLLNQRYLQDQLFDPDSHFCYLRMNKDTFGKLLQKVETYIFSIDDQSNFTDAVGQPSAAAQRLL